MTTGTDSSVQLPTNQGGPVVATTKVTRDDGVTVVERQETILSDPTTSDAKAAVTASTDPDEAFGVVVRGVFAQLETTNELLTKIVCLLELALGNSTDGDTDV